MQNQYIIHSSVLLQSAQGSALDWRDVWEHAIADCQVAVVLRLALDDGSASVISAAAEALAKLVGPTHLGPAQACPLPSGMKWQLISYLHDLSAPA